MESRVALVFNIPKVLGDAGIYSLRCAFCRIHVFMPGPGVCKVGLRRCENHSAIARLR
jgi:hypothetical protein